MSTHTEDRAKLVRVIYVAGFCPNTATPDGGGATGGFEWRRDPQSARKILNEWIEEDCTIRDSHEDLLSDYVFRAVRVPDDVAIDNGEAVTAWLDEVRELWETHSQQAPRPSPDGYCHACAVPEHDACSLNPNCPCCADTIARMNGREP